MKVAIVGASGLVGSCLAEQVADKFPQAKLTLYGQKSVGKKVSLRGKYYQILPTEQIFENLPDVAMLMANEVVAGKIATKLAKLGVTCIDNSSQFRLKSNVPLVVPSVNAETIGNNKIIANPNCTTIQIAIALHPLKCLEPIKMTVATYQATSGMGKDGLDDLQQRRPYGKLKAFCHPIWDNVIPHVGKFQKDGHTSEEQKIRLEMQKILQIPLPINAFCVRVPVTIGHGVFVNLQLAKPFGLGQVKKLLRQNENLLIFDQPKDNLYPLPSMLRGTKYVGVGRIHRDGTSNGLNMFVVADNLLRGASANAMEILQIVAKREGFCE